MRIAYSNMADLYTVLTSSPAITGYPVSNVQDMRISQTYRTSELSTATIVMNLGTRTDSSSMTVAIVGHNFTSSVSIIAGFGPDSTTQTIAYNSNMILKFFDTVVPITYSQKLLAENGDFLTTEDGKYLTTEYDYTTFQLTISDPTNTNGYLEIGRVWVGKYITIDPSSLLDFKVIKKRSDYVQYGRNRQKWANGGVGWRRFELNFPPSEEVMIEQINTMYDEIGNYKSLIFCNFDIIRNYVLVEPCYCSIDGSITFNHTERMKMSYSLNLEEDL